MAAGLISRTVFLENISQLCRVSDHVNDGWTLEKVQGELILCKTDVKQVTRSVIEPDRRLDDQVLEEDSSLDVEADSACLQINTDTVTDTFKFEYHILYCESYSVPVLYLNVNKSDGKLLSLEELWDLIPQVYRDRLEVDRWTFITQQEHPLLGRPFYQLHPCYTERLMENIRKPGICEETVVNETRNYLVTWLSAVGPVVHLKLPLTYGQIPL